MLRAKIEEQNQYLLRQQGDFRRAADVVTDALMAFQEVEAVAVIGSVVLMADGTAYPLTLPAVFYALYSVALVAGPGRTLAVGVTVKAVLLTASLITHPGITKIGAQLVSFALTLQGAINEYLQPDLPRRLLGRIDPTLYEGGTTKIQMSNHVHVETSCQNTTRGVSCTAHNTAGGWHLSRKIVMIPY